MSRINHAHLLKQDSRPSHGCSQHRKYSLTCDQYSELREAAGGRCQICRRLGSETKSQILFIDHDHAIGYPAVRGLLCCRCNGYIAMSDRWRTEEEKAAIRAYMLNPWHSRLALSPPIPVEIAEMPPEEALRRLGQLALEVWGGERPSMIPRYQSTRVVDPLRAALVDTIRSAVKAGVSSHEIADVLAGIWRPSKITSALYVEGRRVA